MVPINTAPCEHGFFSRNQMKTTFCIGRIKMFQIRGSSTFLPESRLSPQIPNEGHRLKITILDDLMKINASKILFTSLRPKVPGNYVGRKLVVVK